MWRASVTDEGAWSGSKRGVDVGYGFKEAVYVRLERSGESVAVVEVTMGGDMMKMESRRLKIKDSSKGVGISVLLEI